MMPTWVQDLEDRLLVGNSTSSPRTWIVALLLAYWLYRSIANYMMYRSDKAFGDERGCLPMQTWLPYKWPLALDILKRQYDALPEQRVLRLISEYFDTLGPNMTFRLFGSIGFLTADPKNVESILSTHFEDWGMGSRSPGLFPMLGEGIFTQDGRPWKHSREVLRRQFVRVQYQDLTVFDEHVQDLISSLSACKGTVDIQPFLFRFTLATTTALLFGEPVVGIDGEETNTFEKNFDYASYISAIRLRLADLHWLYKPKKFRGACEVVKRYANHFVQLALNDMKEQGEEAAMEKYAFILDLYKDLQDPALVRDQLINVLIAGRDTTACLMSWVFYQLVRHPDVLERLCEEVQSITHSTTEITRAQIHKMPYLKCVINETLRLYPQLPMNVRVAVRTTTIPRGGGPSGDSPVLIRKGTGIGYSVYHMHRLKSVYGEDADDFRPERWQGTELDKLGWGFMPFHGGPRICLGKDFALTEASYAIVRILQAFPKIRLPDGLEVVPPGEERQALTIVVSSADGCKVVLR